MSGNQLAAEKLASKPVKCYRARYELLGFGRTQTSGWNGSVNTLDNSVNPKNQPV